MSRGKSVPRLSRWRKMRSHGILTAPRTGIPSGLRAFWRRCSKPFQGPGPGGGPYAMLFLERSNYKGEGI